MRHDARDNFDASEEFSGKNWESLNAIVRQKTGFCSFNDLINAKGGYRPTIDCSDTDLLRLAEAYDQFMSHIGDTRRVFRYESSKCEESANFAFGA